MNRIITDDLKVAMERHIKVALSNRKGLIGKNLDMQNAFAEGLKCMAEIVLTNDWQSPFVIWDYNNSTFIDN